MSENTGKADKPKRKAPPTAWKPGQSGNPGGRPKNQQSITYWLNEFGNMMPAQLAELCETYAKDLRKVKGEMSMFAHIAVRTLMAQINEPTPGLLAQILDRTEGKVQDKLQVSGDENAPLVVKAFDYSIAITPIAPRPSADSHAPGEDQDGGDGAALGQDHDGG